MGRMSRPRRGITAVAVAAALTATASCTGTPNLQTIQVAENDCGTGWQNPRPGEQTLYLRNTGSNPTTVDLIDVGTGAIYAEVVDMGPNTTRGVRVRIGGGRFAFRCAMENSDNPMITGPVITLPGAAAGPAIAPVAPGDLYGPDAQYTAYVSKGLRQLAIDTDALRADIDRGDTAAARTTWLTAHLDYERLGAAYDAFGEYDDRLDGRADGLPGGVHDPRFTGFHRMEYGLWHTEPSVDLIGPANRLDTDVHALVADFPTMQVPIRDLGLRTHEILENTLQFQLTGDADYGSGTTLATAQANVDGTEELLSVLDPLLRTRYSPLPETTTWLHRFRTLLTAQHHDAHWTPVADLSEADRQHLDGTLGRLLEYLAPIATICTPRKTFQ
ncbi:EfeM/EfeO family lipoprotein [Nocardia sp. NPDC051570]|uniref:EfeM/EfeO family lipoprotein n=1 Tax=Nocardia sp. NPDC051570 TaxID=3364324 RepID=UPI0037B5081A